MGNFSQGLKQLADAFQSLSNVFRRPSVEWSKKSMIEPTNYLCPKCRMNLYLIGHDKDKIHYKCADCNKVFKVYKNNILGTFKTRYGR